MQKKILNVVFFVAFAVVCVFAGIWKHEYDRTATELDSALQSLEQYRLDLELARRANERYADAYRTAKVTNTELGDRLSEHVSTLGQLREQLQAVREQYERMQAVIDQMADIGYSLNGDSDSVIGLGGYKQCTLK